MEFNRNMFAADLAKHQSRTESQSARAKQWVTGFGITAFLFLFVLPLINGDLKRMYDPGQMDLWYWIAGCVFMTAAQIGLADWQQRRATPDLEKAADAFHKNYEKYSGPGWAKRTVLTGVWMGLGVGIPIALLAVFLLPPDFGVGRERWEGAAVFLALTFGWTIPMAFVIRALSMRAMRKYSR